MNCYIIDDDEHAIDAIIKYVGRIPYLTVIGSHTNPLMALDEISKGKKPDIVFLDVEMPELLGIEVAKLLPKEIAIVFTTSYKQYAFDAFQQDVVDFLLKPVSFEMFLRAIEKVKAHLSSDIPINSFDTIFINTGIKGKIVQINIAEIIYIEALKNNLYLHTIHQTYQSRVSLKVVHDKLLLTRYFTRIHRAYVVNLNFIKSIEGNAVTMSNSHNIPVGELYKNDLLKRIESKIIKGTSL